MKNLLVILSAVATIATILYLCNVISKPGHYFKIGKSNGSDVYLRATPYNEYQITMEADSIEIHWFGEKVATLPYESELGHILLQDNE
jgi:hypothetical protein